MLALVRLKRAIDDYRQTDEDFRAARETLRQSVRDLLNDKTVVRGDGLALARKLDITPVHLSNLKGGYTVPSADWAEKLVRVCERNGI